MSVTKGIEIRETAGIDRAHEYVRVAVPWARGEMAADASPQLFDQVGRPVFCQTRVLKQWPDGSVKWLLIDCPVSVPAGGKVVYRLQPGPFAAGEPTARVVISPGTATWHVDTGAGTFLLDGHTFRPVLKARRHGEHEPAGAFTGNCRFVGNDESSSAFEIEAMAVEESGPLHAVIRCKGKLHATGDDGPRFAARLHFFAGNMVVKVEFTLHNPCAARHPGGFWDLGDEGSILFRELAFTLKDVNFEGGKILCRTAPDAAPLTVGDDRVFHLYQESSGGENWRSANHRNREGRVPFHRRGYVAEAGGRELCSGLRATPHLWCGAEEIGIAVAVPRFWQEFPKALDVDAGCITLALFPGTYPDLHELQGGEQKTHAFYVDFAAHADDLLWALSPLQALATQEVYRTSGVFGDLPGDEDLVDQFITAEAIRHKREGADEYGWRNFGDIHADHEAVFQQGDEGFVSHYNNQYDFCAGAYRKSFVTGSPEWGNLAADLARHVLDIDIYHTARDREEYNGGLFWHTDHYVHGGLSTHRSFSREQLAGKDPRLYGGGPGAEHCYTTGLLLHYFHTGNDDYREAVIALAEWELLALNGPQTVLAAMKRGLGYVKLWRALRTERRLFPRYPLTRGTGNAISACVDAFEAGGGRRYLDEAERLIRSAIHPDDDIGRRDLLNAEVAWSYTVFLVSVVKFLDKKLELDEQDDGFFHARESLLSYARWMMDNEYPYLDKPEILEYPNETWATQDLRKSVIFYHAARFSPSEKCDSFLGKSRYFFQVASEQLGLHETNRFARPVTLMLQNGWVGGRLLSENMATVENSFTDLKGDGHPTPYLTLPSVLCRIAGDLLLAIRRTSLIREWEWLRVRLY